MNTPATAGSRITKSFETSPDDQVKIARSLFPACHSDLITSNFFEPGKKPPVTCPDTDSDSPTYQFPTPLNGIPFMTEND